MSTQLTSNTPPDAWRDALARRFSDLPEGAQLSLASKGRPLQLQRGQACLRPGERWESALWVEAGALRLYYLDPQGAEWNKNFHLDDAFIWPLTPWLCMAPVGFCIEALELTLAWALPMPDLEDAVAALPSWSHLRLQALSHLLEDKMRREQVFLQQDAQQRYQTLLEEHPGWAGRIPLRHLASYLGMTDVSLSRLRARMGLIGG